MLAGHPSAGRSKQNPDDTTLHPPVPMLHPVHMVDFGSGTHVVVGVEVAVLVGVEVAVLVCVEVMVLVCVEVSDVVCVEVSDVVCVEVAVVVTVVVVVDVLVDVDVAVAVVLVDVVTVDVVLGVVTTFVVIVVVVVAVVRVAVEVVVSSSSPSVEPLPRSPLPGPAPVWHSRHPEHTTREHIPPSPSHSICSVGTGLQLSTSHLLESGSYPVAHASFVQSGCLSAFAAETSNTSTNAATMATVLKPRPD